MITLGIDEVGRGCWAGPLVAGAIILNTPIEGLRDSKMLSKIQRNVLSDKIQKTATQIGLGWVWPKEIDEHGLSWAVKTAMERAIENITAPFNEIIIDGNINYLPETANTRCLIKADNTIPAVSAASIMAKVARDAYMTQTAHANFPWYEFNTHVGYGTKRHIELLELYGISSEHRVSYKPIKRLMEAKL